MATVPVTLVAPIFQPYDNIKESLKDNKKTVSVIVKVVVSKS